jgi:hypothetical protein
VGGGPKTVVSGALRHRAAPDGIQPFGSAEAPDSSAFPWSTHKTLALLRSLPRKNVRDVRLTPIRQSFASERDIAMCQALTSFTILDGRGNTGRSCTGAVGPASVPCQKSRISSG